MAFLIGGQTLVIGDSKGGVGSWMFVGGAPTSGGVLTLIHEYTPHHAAVTMISTSARNRGFLTGDTSGKVQYHYSTEGATQLSFDAVAQGSSLWPLRLRRQEMLLRRLSETA